MRAFTTEIGNLVKKGLEVQFIHSTDSNNNNNNNNREYSTISVGRSVVVKGSLSIS